MRPEAWGSEKGDPSTPGVQPSGDDSFGRAGEVAGVTYQHYLASTARPFSDQGGPGEARQNAPRAAQGGRTADDLDSPSLFDGHDGENALNGYHGGGGGGGAGGHNWYADPTRTDYTWGFQYYLVGGAGGSGGSGGCGGVGGQGGKGGGHSIGLYIADSDGISVLGSSFTSGAGGGGGIGGTGGQGGEGGAPGYAGPALAHFCSGPENFVGFNGTHCLEVAYDPSYELYGEAWHRRTQYETHERGLLSAGESYSRTFLPHYGAARSASGRRGGHGGSGMGGNGGGSGGGGHSFAVYFTGTDVDNSVDGTTQENSNAGSPGRAGLNSDVGLGGPAGECGANCQDQGGLTAAVGNVGLPGEAGKQKTIHTGNAELNLFP